MNGQTLKIFGIIQMLFSAAIFITMGESETLNLLDDKAYNIGVYNDSELGGNSLVTKSEGNSFKISVGEAYEHAFAGVYIEQLDKGLINLGESKEITLNISTNEDVTAIVSFEKYLKGEDGTHPFQHGTGVKLNANSKEITFSLRDFTTPSWWLESHSKINKNEVLSDSIVSFNIELKKLGGKPQEATLTVNDITLSTGQNNMALGIGGAVFLVGLILILIPQKKSGTGPVPKNENPIVYYINSNLTSRSLTINSVSEHFKLSTNYIDERVKTETGLSYKHYINQKRVDKAKELLKTTDEKAFEIAQLCGFNSSASFSQTFKAVTGVTPNDFRKS